MIRSMTGYGRWSAQNETHSLTVEASSVNRKNLEVMVSGPKEWFGLDRVAAELAKTRFSRGRVQVQIKLESLSSGKSDGSWDDAVVLEKLGRLKALCVKAGLPFEERLTVDTVIQLIRMNASENLCPDWEAVEPWVREALDGAFSSLDTMRLQEGAALRTDLLERVAAIEAMVNGVSALAPEVAPAWRAALLERLRQSGLDLDPADERVLKEVSLFVDRCDVSEELTRLRSHLEQIRTTLDLDEAVGRKLDFILQEVFREVNTIGSKGNHLGITQLVIAAKNELERLREQAQNIE